MRFRLSVAHLVVFALAATAGCRNSHKNSQEQDVAPIATARACRDGSEWRQRYGTGCVCCHAEFGVAGSVAHDAGVAQVVITDRDGRELAIAPNPFDNFFRHAKMTPPLRAKVVFADGETRMMEGDAPHGSCNECHGDGQPLVGVR